MRKQLLILVLMSITTLAMTGCANLVYARKLSAGAAYDPAVTSHLASEISWSYQEADHRDLEALREELGLDTYLNSISHLSETERIIELISYVHELVEWDGSAPWPEGELNTLNILQYAQEHELGVNCRMKAIILQELYLAAGYPARMISCIPLDEHDADSHVVVSVWSQDMQQWILADPSFNAYVTDSSGKPLSIEEVRIGLIENMSMYLNDGAVIRGEKMEESFYLDYYMKKNLYAFITPMEAVYGYEGSPGERTSVMLLPAREIPKDPSGLIFRYQFRDSDFTRFIISDPELFWAPPR